MTTAVAQARTDLHEALHDVTPSTWRIHRTAPTQPAAPVVFIDSPTISTQSSGLVAVSFPVVMVVDGTIRAQLEQLDDLLAAVWTAAAKVGRPTSTSPAALDVGGPSLRAQVLTVEIVIAAVTLCPPSLTTSARS